MNDDKAQRREVTEGEITGQSGDASSDSDEFETECINGCVWTKRDCQGCGWEWSENTESGRWLCKKCFECWECGEIVSGGGTLCEECREAVDDDDDE
jgi:hypothetical protein